MKKALAAALGAAMVLVLPQAAHATTVVTPPAAVTPSASVVAVNIGPGDQTDPHVSGDWVVYTDFSGGIGRVRYHNVVTNVDGQIPGIDGASDSLPDISGTTATFVRFGSGSHSIWTYDVAAGGSPVELDPQPSSNRREAAVGGRTVAWQDFGVNPLVSPEIVTYDLDTHVVTRLTTDSLYDRDPAVSADGNTVTWSKCTSLAGGCDVLEASRTGTTWAAAALTNGGAESTLPDTNGQVAVYGRSAGVDEADIVSQPVGGGTETELAMPSLQENPNISRDVVVFESYDPTASTANFDIYAYDLIDGQLYRLTDTPEDESLNDVSVAPDGTATVVFSRLEDTGDDNVYAERFVVPGEVPAPTLAAIAQPPLSPSHTTVLDARTLLLPVIFTLTNGGTPTCNLPPAKVTVTRAGATSPLFVGPFVTWRCQYLSAVVPILLGPGTYSIGVVVDGQQIGSASLTLVKERH